MNLAVLERMVGQGDLSADAFRYLLNCRGECEWLDYKESLSLVFVRGGNLFVWHYEDFCTGTDTGSPSKWTKRYLAQIPTRLAGWPPCPLLCPAVGKLLGYGVTAAYKIGSGRQHDVRSLSALIGMG